MKAVIYARISKEDQSEYSLGAQVEESKAYIEKEKYELVGIYTDDGYSAKNTKRPQLQQMLSDLAAKKFNMVVIWRLDRLTRDTLDGLNMVKNVFKPNGVEFASVTEDIDTSTPDGFMMFTIRLSMAQNEREKIAERVTMGQMSRAKDGKRNSSAKPFGYNVNPEDLSLTINEEEARVIRQIFEWYVSGYGRNKIATLLNTEGIDGVPVPAPRGGIWKDKNISDVIPNWTYAGAVHWKRKTDPEEKRVIVHGAHEPIVSLELFEQANKVMKRRFDNTMSLSSYDFAFTTIMKCGECGRAYHGKVRNADKWRRRTRNYRCSGKYRQDSCGASDISEIKLTELFMEFLSKFTVTTQEPNKIIGTKDIEKDRKRLTKQLEESNVKKKNYARAMGAGKLDYETFEELVDEENKKSLKWREELDQIEQIQPTSKRTMKDVLKIINNLRDNWSEMSYVDQKRIVQQLFEVIVIKKINEEWKIVGHKLAE